MNVRTLCLQVLLPLAVLAVGILGMKALIDAKPAPPRREVRNLAPLVEVVAVESATGKGAVVRGMGTVKPARTLTLTPEVSGRVVAHHPSLEPGGRFETGALVVQLDDRDYKLAVTREGAMVTRAKAEVALETGRKTIAEREWEVMAAQLGKTADSKGRELALRSPQGKAARANVTAARSSLQRARLSLERTEIRAPFDAFVQDESVEVGQWVGPGAKLATLVGTEHFWVEVSVPVDQLAWLGLGHHDGDGALPTATVTQRIGSEGSAEHQGRVLRVLNQLDPLGRMARLLIEVDDPLGITTGRGEGRTPLRLGAYVEVAVQGRSFDGGVTVPRDALRESGKLWVVSSEGKIEIRTAAIGWRERDRVLVTSGVKAGERVIITALSTVTDGMEVRIAGESTADAKAEAKP
jgi:RND family efflux transporter MFP subunit